MRFTILKLPNLMLAFMPFIIAYNGHGIIGTIFWMILWAAIRQLVILNNRGGRTYKNERTNPDQVFGRLVKRQYFLTENCYLVDKNQFILKDEKTIDRLELIRNNMEMIIWVIVERFEIWS